MHAAAVAESGDGNDKILMIAAVDLGSTNLKAALFRVDGSRLAEASSPLPYLVHTNGRSELDPTAVEDCFFEVLGSLISNASVRWEDVRRVALTSQAQTFCLCDETGRVISPFFGWEDTRAVEEASLLQRSLGAEFHRESGWPKVGPGLMVAKILWLRNNSDWSESHQIVSLPSFLAMRLGGPHVTDRNLSAMSGLYSLTNSSWSLPALEALRIHEHQLGKLVDPGQTICCTGSTRLGASASDFGIVMAGNDHTAGALGCGCHQGRSILTLGTAGVIYRQAGGMPGPFPEGGLWGPFPSGGYYELLCLNHACSALDWADKFLSGTVDSQRFAGVAAGAEFREDSPLFYPSQWGTSAAWLGEGNINELAFAVFEGIAFALRNMANGMLADGEIVVLGGGSRLDFWVQLMADTFQMPVFRSKRDGLDGAAKLAGCKIPDDGAGDSVRHFPPNRALAGRIDQRFARWNSPNPAGAGAKSGFVGKGSR